MALPGSDVFTMLPPELRVQVLTSTGRLSTVLRLIQASPVMLQQYLAHKMYIIRKFLNYDQNMMQDAVAIILFPRLQLPDLDNSSWVHSNYVRQHMLKWSESQFKDPLDDNDDRLVRQVIKLHDQMILYIEDYITKATAYYPSREYLCLPQMHDAHEEGYLMFKGTKVAPRFDSTRLTALERSKFVRAFLMYTLTRKCNSIRCFYYEMKPRKITKSEEEAFCCVVKYFWSLYGAIFAQCTDAWLPSNSSATSLESGLLFPDNFYFDADAYATDKGITEVFNNATNFAFFVSPFPSSRDSPCAAFELLGPDRLADFLRFDMVREDEREALEYELQSVQASEQPLFRHEFSNSLFAFPTGRKERSPFYMLEPPPLGRYDDLAERIRQQRAWVFFDDHRFYPEETAERPNLPSKEFLMDQPSKQVNGYGKYRFFGQYEADYTAEVPFPARYLIYGDQWKTDILIEIPNKIDTSVFRQVLLHAASSRRLENGPAYEDELIKVRARVPPAAQSNNDTRPQDNTATSGSSGGRQ